VHLRGAGIIEGAGIDYPFRVFAARADLQKAAAALVAELDYPNFKDAVAERSGREASAPVRTNWSVLRRLEEGASG
jgi:hypothetical protein